MQLFETEAMLTNNNNGSTGSSSSSVVGNNNAATTPDNQQQQQQTQQQQQRLYTFEKIVSYVMNPSIPVRNEANRSVDQVGAGVAQSDRTIVQPV